MKQFYICEICGNTIEMLEDSGVIPHCCNAPMKELPQHTEDMGKEKHVPEIHCKCIKLEDKDCRYSHITVKVGAEPHPMTPEHYIEWIMLETDKGTYRIKLDPGCAPEACLLIPESEKILAVYSYCNIHGLWINKKACEK